MTSAEDQLRALRRGAVEIIEEKELAQRLRRGHSLRVKAGLDPTAPDLHLGHLVLLQKLRQFQELGHEVYLLIGDFTATIGDPSGRSETRPPLSEEEVRRNARTYREQAFKVLDPTRTHLVFNGEWLRRLEAAELIRLAARHTVARMLEREDFQRRFREGRPIGIHEFLYPLLQGYDSVALRADVEVGGTDQKFNMLLGRQLQRELGQPPQVIITLPILEGLDGRQKMSKSLGNYVGLTEPPEEMFGKLMSISDELLPHYYALLTDRGFAGAEQLDRDIQAGKVHPMDAKKELAGIIVERYHGAEAAAAAREEFESVFSRGNLPSEMPELELTAAELNDGAIWIVKLVVDAGFAASNGEARRLVRQGAVKLNDKRIEDEAAEVTVSDGDVLQVGKRRFARLKLT